MQQLSYADLTSVTTAGASTDLAPPATTQATSELHKPVSVPS